jgi:AAA15 family ATPase/GTPase
MIKKIAFKNYKSFKDWQELEIKPMTVLIGKNSSGKSAIAKLLALIEYSLKGESESPLKLTGYDNGVELGAEFEDLIYGRSRTGKLELELNDNDKKLSLVIGTEKEIPKIFSWAYNGIEKLGFDNTFKGFHLETLSKELLIDELSLNIDYIGPFRLSPPREFSDFNLNAEVNKVGYRGEGAYSLLLQDGMTTLAPLVSKVNQWYEENFEGWGIQVNKDLSPFFQMEITRKKNAININLKDVGQGMSQALPLVVKAFTPIKQEELSAMEQPELHLHPAAHGNLGELFVKSLEDQNRFYLIETHSQNFILRLRRLIAEKKYKWFTPDKFALYFVDFNETLCTSSIRRIFINQNGDVDFWPTNIFSETLDEVVALRTAQDQME